jgi:general secretion pathway protein M
MMEWWQAREPRERLFLLAALLVVTVTLGYGLFWQPLADAYSKQSALKESQTKTLLWMQQAAQQVKALGGQQVRRPVSSRSLLDEAERAAASNGMKASLKQLNPEGRDKLRVTVQDADFDTLIRWLGRLDSVGVTISSLTLSRIDEGQKVQARLLLERRS